MSQVRKRPATDRRRLILSLTLGLLVLAVIVAVGYFSRTPDVKQASTAATYADISPGQPAPDFSVSTTSGPFQLSKAKGKPTLLEVFATWCPHCQAEVAVLNKLYAANRNTVNIVAVSGSDTSSEVAAVPESQADVIAFATKFNVQYPIAYDSELTVAKQYLQGGFPTVVLIGKDGKIQAVQSGEIPFAGLNGALTRSLAGKRVDPGFGR